MNSKDFRNVLLFLFNRWSDLEAKRIFNAREDGTYCEWQFSMGEHIWNKWVYACENHGGPVDGVGFFLTELDNEKLQKLIDRALEYYSK